MKIEIIFKITIFLVVFFLFSCSNKQSGNKEKELDPAIKKNIGSPKTDIIEKHDNELKDDDKHPKILTYTEIFDKKDELYCDYEEDKRYNPDTISFKNQLNQRFYNYLTTQLKYMLSSELRILRNELFARKGYKFNSKDLQEYFESFRWYNAETDDITKLGLSKIEHEIIDTIKVYEEKNHDLNSKYLKEELRNYFKNNLKHNYQKYIVEVPSILFRRNIGYLIKGMPQYNKNWFNDEYLTIKVMDTLENENLILGLFAQADCPAEYCIYAGEIVSCDSALNYIDSHSVYFEGYKSFYDDYGAIYSFKMPYHDDYKTLRIQNDGHIVIAK